jgi:hypothetical protein
VTILTGFLGSGKTSVVRRPTAPPTGRPVIVMPTKVGIHVFHCRERKVINGGPASATTDRVAHLFRSDFAQRIS